MPADLRAVKNFPQLLRYLRDELLWPIESDDAEELSFEYAPTDFAALAPEHHVQIDKILQLRPLVTGQPWGIFYVQFKKARLPVVVLRELLASLVFKKRASANKSERPAWECHDLLFISSYGEESDQRHLNFAHFSDSPNGSHLPALRVLDWDEDDTNRALQRLDGTLHERLRWPEDDTNLEKWREQWSATFQRGLRHPIRKAEQLAHALAALAQNIRRSVIAQMAVESEQGKLRTLHTAFKATLIQDLEPKQFADMFAQTVAYGLFTNATRRTVAGAGTAITADGAVESITSLSPFLRDLLDEFLSVGGRRRGGLDYDKLGVNEVVDLLNAESTDLTAVLDDFGHKKRDDDPVIHFYETFLEVYDKDEKIRRGVFYTPQPVVSYIVRSVHELLQSEFGLPHGLASTETWGELIKRIPDLTLPNISHDKEKPKQLSPDEFFVQILDPATGTATFIVESITVIFQHLKSTWETRGGLGAMPDIRCKQSSRTPPKTFTEFWNLYVPASLLPRLYGYELMMAPYAIAHMKVALKLADTGFSAWKELTASDRVQIYLTNALEPAIKQKALIGFEALAHEADAVNKVKWDKRFTVVIGNPPYSNFGQLNRIPFILDLLEDYKRGLGEKKLNLDDDFIKFVCFSQFLVASTGVGCVGMITNNSYLDGITHRRMRQSLLESFGRISVIDLHGSTKRREVAPDGTPDDNVFDIQQGVSIVLLRRLIGNSRAIQHTDLWGTRAAKYAALSNGSCINAERGLATPEPPQYFFVPKVFTAQGEYNEFYPLRDAVVASGNGLKTERDSITIHFEKAGIEATVDDFRKLSEVAIRLKYGLETDSRDWKVAKAKTDVLSNKGPTFFHQLLYRPFDSRQTWYSGQTRGFIGTPGYPIMKHLLGGNNLALISGRQGQVMGDIPWDLMLCSSLPVDTNLYYRGGNTVFPLYLCDEVLSFDLGSKEDIGTQSANRRPNFTAPFLRRLAGSLQLSQSGPHGLPAGLTPEDIFHYAYAVFHSPGYRSRYAEFLKIDFPRLPLTENVELFRTLARLGGELVTLHLLESPKLDKHITEYLGGRAPEVEKVSWSDNTVWLDKDQTTGFKGISEEIWNFHIGGYQVCEKWLKDRKGRKLSADDRSHYQKIVVALSETIRLMADIDKAIAKHGGWPDAFAGSVVADTSAASGGTREHTQSASQDLGIQTEDELPLG